MCSTFRMFCCSFLSIHLYFFSFMIPHRNCYKLLLRFKFYNSILGSSLSALHLAFFPTSEYITGSDIPALLQEEISFFSKLYFKNYFLSYTFSFLFFICFFTSVLNKGWKFPSKNVITSPKILLFNFKLISVTFNIKRLDRISSIIVSISSPSV